MKSFTKRKAWIAIAGLMFIYGVACLIKQYRSSAINLWAIGFLFTIVGGIGLLISFNLLSLKVVRIVRWGVLLWHHVAYTPVMVLLLVAFISRVSWIEACLDKCLFSPYFELFVWPAAVANTINGFILMVEGRKRANWPWWRQLVSLFAIGIPVFGVFYYAKCEKKFRLLQDEQQDYNPK
jgi:hypothetical protein